MCVCVCVYMVENVVRGSYKSRVYGLGSQNNVRRLQLYLDGIGSSSQVEGLDDVQIAAMLDQIAKLPVAVVELERKRVDEQERMSATVHQIKEQVINFVCGSIVHAPDDTYNDNFDDEDDCVGSTP